jgi:hypothetical protein
VENNKTFNKNGMEMEHPCLMTHHPNRQGKEIMPDSQPPHCKKSEKTHI